MADNKPAVLGGTAIKPKERHGWEAVRYLIHNPETGEYLTRTPKSWALIIVFYLIYYSCLAGFWAAMLNIFFLTIPDHEPKWKTDKSLICDWNWENPRCGPGLGMRPKQPSETIDSSMIQFYVGSKPNPDSEIVQHSSVWQKRAADFVAELSPARKAKLGACGTDVGYDAGTPCIFLKLNKVIDLVNEPYEVDDLDNPDSFEGNLGVSMPDTLKDHIKNQNDKKFVWVECHGQYAADEEAIGPLQYWPSNQGFPVDVVYKGKVDKDGQLLPYEAPIVAVKFTNPKKDQLLHVECRAWARNIKYDKRDRLGINLFELHILDKQISY